MFNDIPVNSFYCSKIFIFIFQQVTLKPNVSPNLRQEVAMLVKSETTESAGDDRIAVGTTCKNNGCKQVKIC